VLSGLCSVWYSDGWQRITNLTYISTMVNIRILSPGNTACVAVSLHSRCITLVLKPLYYSHRKFPWYFPRLPNAKKSDCVIMCENVFYYTVMGTEWDQNSVPVFPESGSSSSLVI
jgi:hypothetical protein